MMGRGVSRGDGQECIPRMMDKGETQRVMGKEFARRGDQE